MNRFLALALLLGLGLRCLCAVVTQTHPLVPPHAYNDARDFDEKARLYAEAWSAGTPDPTYLTPGKELYTLWTAFLYRLFGPRPLLPKLFNALLGALSILLWARAAAPLVGETAAAACAALLALWPTHVFFSSQHLKESPTLLLAAAAAYLLLPAPAAWEGPAAAWRRRASPALGAAALAILGLFRFQLVPVLAASLLGGHAFAVVRDRHKGSLARSLIPGAWILIALAGFRPLSKALMTRFHSDDPDRARMVAVGVPASGAGEGRGAFGPAWLGALRRNRQARYQEWSREQTGRTVETRIFPDEELATWGDFLRFLPKGAFYALFMPLPGLYPLEGKLGRLLASMENLVLLGLFLAALPAFRLRPSPGAVSLALFFASMAALSAFFEFDLGGAARHRLLYFPALFPFAALTLIELRKKLPSSNYPRE